MKKLLLTLSFIIFSLPAYACSGAMNIVNADKSASRVYKKLNDHKDFMQWIQNCKERLLSDVAVAVHESVHGIRNNTDKLLTIDGRYLNLPKDENSAEPRSFVFKKLGSLQKSDFAQIYVSYKKNEASSAYLYSYFLDEFNAYTHSLNVINNGRSKITGSAAERDGLAAFMAFAAIYVNEAYKQNGATWRNLKKENVMIEIWKIAERVMEESCDIPNISHEANKWLNLTCANSDGMSKLLGRKAKCQNKIKYCVKGNWE